MDPEIVWLLEDEEYAEMVTHGAFFSVVQKSDGSVVVVENPEFEFWKERVIEYESDE